MKRISIVGLIFALGLLLAIGWSISSQGQQKTHASSITNAGFLHAIQPHLASVDTAGNVSPTYTISDVQQYLQTVPFQGRMVSGQPLTYTITFLTSQSLGQQLNEDFSGNAATLCYVRIPGPLVLDRGITPSGAIPQVYAYGYIVFDGLTGDQIEWGARPH